MTNKYNKRHLPFGHSAPIKDKETLALLDTISNISAVIYDEDIHNKFLDEYVDWIKSSTNNSFLGLDNFAYKCLSNGTTEAFDKFYINHSSRRFRCFKGEYLYHRLAWKSSGMKWAYIEDAPLDVNDVVVTSYPFADTGDKHEQLDSVLEQCNKLNIPVLLDCAYFGLCANLQFDLTHPCIQEVTFSLSKTFPVSHIRVGMRLSRVDTDDALFVINKNGYINRLAAHIGHEFIKNFSPDYIYNKYRSKQINICDILKIKPTNTVVFGLAETGWEEYNRDRQTSRLGLHNFLYLDDLTSLYQHAKN